MMARYPIVAASPPPPARYKRARLFPSFRAHWRLFAGVFASIVALTTIVTLLVPKQYTATAKMVVSNAQPSSPALQNIALNSEAIANLIQDSAIAGKVIDALKLNQSPAELLGSVRVKVVPNTSLITLSATAGTPAQAAAIANAFSAVFIDRDRDLVSSQAVTSQAFLQKAIANAQDRLQQANSALSAYQARYDIEGTTLQAQPLIEHNETIEAKLEEVQEDEKQAQAQLSSAQSQMATLPATVAGQQVAEVNPATAELRQQLAETETQLATARSRYTDKHPAVLALEQQRDELQRQLSAEPVTVAGQTIAVPNPVYQQLSQQSATLRSQIQGDIAKVTELETQQKALAPALAALPAQTTQLSALTERAKLSSDVYEALEQKYEDAVVAANSAISDVASAQAADANAVTVWPNLAVNVIASIIAGLIVGLIAVAVAEAIKRRIRVDRDVEHSLGLPVIAHIPSMSGQHQNALPWLQAVTLEAFLHLCASLRILGHSTESHVIVITSPEKGDGKTTIAYYLAAALSKLRSRVLLIDADMRCPATHLKANIENGPGLSDVLSGASSFEAVVVHHTSTFDILTAGTIPSNPVALAESESLDDLLKLVRGRYSCVIIDTPALTRAADSVLIAARADHTALVLSANNSHEAAAAQAVARLRSLGIENVLGVVMNRATTTFSDYASSPTALQR